MTDKRLSLPDVTLCAIDTRTPQLAMRALKLSMQHIEFGDVLLFSKQNHGLDEVPSGVRVVPIEELKSIEDYSNFALRSLRAHLQTSHLLLTQWDGYVRNPQAWRPEFLAYDYIGAPWPEVPVERAVGNGGFSLRSRKLLEAIADPAFKVSHPEDVCICHDNRELLQQHGVRIAPCDLALSFSQERVTTAQESFGFHGAFHLMTLMSPAALKQLIKDLPERMTCSLEIKELAKRLIASHHPEHLEIAELLVKRRFSAGLRDPQQIRLWARLCWRRLARRPKPLKA
jgi:hypothetical protein